MSGENIPASPAESKPEIAQAKEEVNKLLRELEGMVDEVQHSALTDFLGEWAVLSAMRTTLAVQNKALDASATENPWQAGEPGKGE